MLYHCTRLTSLLNSYYIYYKRPSYTSRDIYHKRLTPMIDSRLVGSTCSSFIPSQGHEGFRESRRCCRDTYTELCITEYIPINEGITCAQSACPPSPDAPWGGTQDKKMSKSLSTLRLEGSPTQSRISPGIQRILRLKRETSSPSYSPLANPTP